MSCLPQDVGPMLSAQCRLLRPRSAPEADHRVREHQIRLPAIGPKLYALVNGEPEKRGLKSLFSVMVERDPFFYTQILTQARAKAVGCEGKVMPWIKRQYSAKCSLDRNSSGRCAAGGMCPTQMWEISLVRGQCLKRRV